MGATIFHACIRKLSQVSLLFLLKDMQSRPYIQCAQLGVGVFMVDALLERAHGLLRLNRLGSDDIGDFEVEGNVLTRQQYVRRGVSFTMPGLQSR